MADGYVSIDFTQVLRAIGSMENSVNGHIESVRNEVYQNMSVLKNDLEQLKKSFITMMEENRRAAALQRALTEIIRVRQELERDYGNYKLVRNTMLGILEATDMKLIRQTTITSCTEELMLSTPRYWLAPVLIALSAWISDNRDLATRALAEAMRRDEEKTCLVFALICRRNQHTKACFEWLSRYFSMQKANDMNESIIAYIDAYTNGVFGEDHDNLCEEYIQNWMNELQSQDANFAPKQIQYWESFYQTICRDTRNQFAKLAECAKNDFEKMNAYVMRINAAPDIVAFFAHILNVEVDKRELVTAIDNELIKLVKNYDTDEAPLREEEEYLTDIKNSNGDENFANKRRELRRANRMDKKVDLAERLSEAITSNNSSNVSAKKTAIRFMQDYIKGAFKTFVEEKAEFYPQEITISTNGWSGKTKDGSNKKELEESYANMVSEKRQEELSKVKNTGMIVCFVLGGILLVLAIIGFIMGKGFAWPALIGAILFVVIALVKMSSNKKKREDINRVCDEVLSKGTADIDLTIKQYLQMNEIVNNFDAIDFYNRLLLTEGN